jgi:hypothetical protein
MGGAQNQLFSQANLEALIGHLPAGVLSAELVEAVSSAASEEDARIRIEALMDKRLEGERGKLDVTAPNA